ncbi:MAG TPA: hypothetical protein PK200_18690 [Spirochaetota bacterium]|nr:hypothetical protein [Spirochaetota bacterium]
MADEKKDYTEAFSLQMRKFRPWGAAFFAWFAVLIVGSFIVLAMECAMEHFLYFLIAMLLLVVPLVLRTITALRCPACGRFMGRDVSKFCTLCGAQIRK